MDDRKQFLIAMYGQMWSNINRHIIVVWHSVAALVGAFALLALVEKKVLPLDLAASLLIVMAGWLIAHVIDASQWYNRNLVITANIERQFLVEQDMHDIHPYFTSHIPANHMIRHLWVQFALACAIASLILCYHFIERIAPMLGGARMETMALIPYLVSLLNVILLVCFWRRSVAAQRRLLERSPGREIEPEARPVG